MSADMALVDREIAVRQREAAAGRREEVMDLLARAQHGIGRRNDALRAANEQLVIATLAAKELTEAAERTRARQDEFLAMLAHELRNPLAVIATGAAILMRAGGDAATQTPIGSLIERQARHMTRLLDDLLDVSRVRTGKVTLQRQRTNVADVVAQAMAACRTLVDSQRQRLTLDLPAAPIHVDGDPVRLAQIVGNLLQNSAKYTPAGGAITVEVRALAEAVTIRVRDDGVGISAAALPHVFDLFAQDERSLDRSQGGLGIGLTVVRGMVELHGGSVVARSDGPGHGSEFVVTLPRLWRAAAAALPPRPAFVPTPARILLVDDNVDIGDMTAMLLGMSGHEVVVAVDGPGALAAFAQQRPEVVICDIGLQGMDGYQVAMRMRDAQRGPMPLMIAVTGYGTDKDRQRALAAGFDHHLIKPADTETLLRLIETAVTAAPVQRPVDGTT